MNWYKKASINPWSIFNRVKREADEVWKIDIDQERFESFIYDISNGDLEIYWNDEPEDDSYLFELVPTDKMMLSDDCDWTNVEEVEPRVSHYLEAIKNALSSTGLFEKVGYEGDSFDSGVFNNLAYFQFHLWGGFE
jgi:hypothetical protein